MLSLTDGSQTALHPSVGTTEEGAAQVAGAAQVVGAGAGVAHVGASPQVAGSGAGPPEELASMDPAEPDSDGLAVGFCFLRELAVLHCSKCSKFLKCASRFLKFN